MTVEIGSLLRQAREQRGLSLADVEEQTKIRSKYLEALENENFDKLPGQVYVRGFLKTYARFLDLDANDLLARYDNAFVGMVANEINLEDTQPEAKSRFIGHRWAAGAVVVALALMLMVGVSLLRGDHDQATPGGQLTGQDHRQGTGEGVQPGEVPDDDSQNGTEQPEPVPPTPTGLSLSLDVRERDCWMQVVVDGIPAFEGNVQAGNTKNFQGERTIKVWVGNAGAVHVNLNGESLGYLGEVNQVVRKEFHTTVVPDGNRSS